MKRMLACLVLVAMVGGCDRDAGKKAPAPSAQASKGVIGLSVLTMTNPFFKDIADHMADEAKTHGFEVVAVSGEKDPARQYGQVKEFIVKKVSAIVLTPCDSKAVGAAIKEA